MTDSTHLFQASSEREFSDFMDTTSYQNNDGRSDTHTTIMPYKESNISQQQKARYSYLAKLNDGMHKSSRAWDNTKANRRRLVEVYGSELELTAYQVDRIKHILRNISMRFGNYGYEQSILAFVTLVCDESGRHVRDEDEFKRLMESMELNSKQLRSLRKLAFERMVENENIHIDQS